MFRPLFALVPVGLGCTPEPTRPDPADPVDPVDTETLPTTPDPTPTPTSTTSTLPIRCEPPPLQALADIPDQPSLAAVDDGVEAAFEVDGDALVGKFVRNPVVAEGALVLWQELVLRIPLNQRSQLVQFTVFGGDSGLAAYVDNNGTANQVGRYGPSLYVHASNILDNDPDVCAPLSGRRGTYDWTLIHEFAHLRQYADGTVDLFVEQFGDDTGPGEGYPADGSPSLDGDWVTSYAERAGGDEDAAESFTAFVMLDPLPTEDSVAGDKVRMFSRLPGYEELRLALRVTEPGGGGVPVPAAPTRSYDLDIDNPVWLQGTWRGASVDAEVEYDITADDVISRRTTADGTEEMAYARLRDDGTLATVRVLESGERWHLYQVSIADEAFSESFSMQEGGVLEVSREGYEPAWLTRY